MPEDDLQRAYSLFAARDYKNAAKAAEKARRRLEKEDPGRAYEALRVQADSTLNARDIKGAESLYTELMRGAKAKSLLFYQAAASWGLGEVASHRMDYAGAARHFETGLEQARSIADKWYTAWNALGLGRSYRGLGRLDDARKVLTESLRLFKEQNQPVFAGWAEKLLKDIGEEVSTPRSGPAKVWLCPMCGSRFTAEQAQRLAAGKMVTCEYCGTTVG